MRSIAATAALLTVWLFTTSHPGCHALDLSLGKEDTVVLNATMPAYDVPGDDAYLCTSVALPSNEPLQLIGFHPLSSKEVVHHMLLFGERRAMKDFCMQCIGPSGPHRTCASMLVSACMIT